MKNYPSIDKTIRGFDVSDVCWNEHGKCFTGKIYTSKGYQKNESGIWDKDGKFLGNRKRFGDQMDFKVPLAFKIQWFLKNIKFISKKITWIGKYSETRFTAN